MPDGTDGVILELGANDALRGVSPEKAKDNLIAIIESLQGRDIPVMLMGMMAPPNMGADYAEAFNPIYGALADQYGVPLYPFFSMVLPPMPVFSLPMACTPMPKASK
nr:GDSL-type esterase/lipase family protein [Marinicella sp. W31]MDC2879932.1 GDSL-type esterase/lipase family protein [Marinicella sp. W31]